MICLRSLFGVHHGWLSFVVFVETKIGLKNLLSRKDAALRKICWTLSDNEFTWQTVSYLNSSFRYAYSEQLLPLKYCGPVYSLLRLITAIPVVSIILIIRFVWMVLSQVSVKFTGAILCSLELDCIIIIIDCCI